MALFEDVRAEQGDDLSLSFAGPIDCSGLPTDRRNIAIKAAHLLQARTGFRGGARLSVVKRVPIAGGMGGGSADAAATLVALDALWGLGVGREDLAQIGAELGADVPFALLGGTAIGTGRGDTLSPALTKGTFHWLFALADRGMSTPEVYAALDEHRSRHAADIRPAGTPAVDADVLQALRAGDPQMLAEALHNDLQAAALHMRPELAAVLELGERNGALAGIVSGSGPSIAFLAADLDSALSLQIALGGAAHGPAGHGAGPRRPRGP